MNEETVIQSEKNVSLASLSNDTADTQSIDMFTRKMVLSALLDHMIVLEENLLIKPDSDIEKISVEAYFLERMYQQLQNPTTPVHQAHAINAWLAENTERKFHDEGTPATKNVLLSHEPDDVLTMIANIAKKAPKKNIHDSDINDWLTLCESESPGFQTNNQKSETRGNNAENTLLPAIPSSTKTTETTPSSQNKHMIIMRKIKKHIDSKRLKVISIFKQFDTSGDGMLSKVEFRKGIEALLSGAVFEISKEEINEIFNSIDVDSSNEVSFREFLKELRNSDPARQASLLAKQKASPTLHEKHQIARKNKILQMKQEKIKKQTLTTLDQEGIDGKPTDALAAVSKRAQSFLRKNMQKAIHLFREMDTSGDGLIDEDELREGMKILGLQLTESEFDGLWYGLDRDGSGACDLKEVENALRDSDPKRKRALEFYSRPPTLKPRNSISRAIAKRNRRVPGSLSWIMSPSTPKIESFMKRSNPAYQNETLPRWKNSGTVSSLFPTAYKNILPMISSSDSDMSPMASPMSSPIKSPIRKKKKKITESAKRRYRNQKFLDTIRDIKLNKHLASAEERILRSIIMREGYIQELVRLFRNAEPQIYIHKKKHPFLDYKRMKLKQKKRPKRSSTSNSSRRRQIIQRQPRGGTGPASKTYMNIKQLRPAVAHLLEDLQRMSSETVELIEEWSAERARLRRKIEEKRNDTNVNVLQENKGTPPLHPKSNSNSSSGNGNTTPLPKSCSEPFMWKGHNYIAKMASDLNFLYEHRQICVEAMKRHFKIRSSRQQAMELDSSKSNPMENVSTQTMLNLTRRSEDFGRFFDKHDVSGDGKLQIEEFHEVLKDMGVDFDRRQLNELYAVLDRDGDGEIDTKELLRGITDTQRASETAWIRFELAEQIMLKNLSEYIKYKPKKDEQDGMMGTARTDMTNMTHTTNMSNLTNITGMTNMTNETIPSNLDGHSELYRLLLHSRAEFKLSYPYLSSNRSNTYDYYDDDESGSSYGGDEGVPRRGYDSQGSYTLSEYSDYSDESEYENDFE